jgi:hypothetical protein
VAVDVFAGRAHPPRSLARGGGQNIGEAAGLSEHVDFEVQVHLRGDGDGAARPDLVVRLPDGGALPVDAKVPLDTYLDAAEADSDQEREAHLERHLAHVRAKVRELGSRAYHGLSEGGGDGGDVRRLRGSLLCGGRAGIPTYC